MVVFGFVVDLYFVLYFFGFSGFVLYSSFFLLFLSGNWWNCFVFGVISGLVMLFFGWLLGFVLFCVCLCYV